MELRDFAERVLLSENLELKLTRPPLPLTDSAPGTPLRVELPSRPPNLQFAQRRTAPAMPKGPSLGDPARRALAHHVMANHELQALEVMAMVLLAFPSAPTEFRMGLAHIMQDEQRHTRMHAPALPRTGTQFR